MKPPKRNYELVKCDEWITGEISEILYDKEREFKTDSGKMKTWGVKFILSLDGYKDKKHTRWFTFNYSENSNLYKFVAPLVDGAHPKMDFDLDALKDLRIKVMYVQNGEYQNISMIRPDGGKVLVTSKPINAGTIQTSDDEVPF